MDFVKDIHQVDSLVTCGNEAFFPFGAMAHRTRLSLLGACGGNEGHPSLCKSNHGGKISHVCVLITQNWMPK